MASNASLGGIKVGYVSTENNKAVNINALGEAYVQLKVPAGAWVGNGLSQHYMDIVQNSTDPIYVPLFKVEKREASSGFRANTRFEVIGRHTASYYGEFMLNYRYGDSYCHDLMMISLQGNNKLAQSDIIATLTTDKIIVYRKLYPNKYPSNKEAFIINITGNNDRGSTSSVDINTMTYYCTEIYEGNGNEVLLNDTTTDPDSAVLTTAPANSLTRIPA